ncbi:MAG: hypothetical protein BWY76_02438 [bacterium ADurb.Bin429]|nr:MAG: hypothetical protein BWY76_02438 [bacterium ADurb.Bin429]
MIPQKPPKTPGPLGPDGLPEKQEGEQLVIERSSDPLQLLSNILEVSGILASQWGEETFLHLRVAALWARIGKKQQAIEYLSMLASAHAADAFNLGQDGVKFRIDLMRYFLTQIGVDEASVPLIVARKADNTSKMPAWLRKGVSRILPGLDSTASLLNSDEEQAVRDIVRPPMSWLEQIYLTPLPGDCRGVLAQQLQAISEYGEPHDVEQRIYQLFDHARMWHERQSDTPIWVHDLDDIGPRVVYLAVTISRPDAIIAYLERCIDALNERPLALMPNVGTAVGGLAYCAKQLRRDDLLHRALDVLPRFPEHERCIAALTLVEVLVERSR